MGKFLSNLIVFIVVVAGIIGGVAYYLGWFSVETQPGDEENKPGLKITIEKEKIEEDKTKVKKTAEDLKDKAKKFIEGEETEEGEQPEGEGKEATP